MRLVAWLLVIGIASGFMAAPPSETDPRETTSIRFPDFGFLPAPNQYEGRVFHLRQDYPKQLPPSSAIPAFCTNNFDEVKKDWKKFMLDVRAYCFAGNILGGDVEDDFRLDNASANQWYHMPWQHYGAFGREGIHGLTKEARIRPKQLAPSQTYADGQTYAVAFYNAPAGTMIGKVWADRDRPGENQRILFPVGTVIFKLLFVDVPFDQVPSLNPALKWQAYITDTFKSTNRGIRNVALIQMDIMVRHQNAPNGWLFGRRL